MLWEFVSVTALFAILAISLRAVRPGLERRDVVLWSFALLAPAYWLEPVRLTLAYGQVNLVLAALVLADLTCTLRVAGRTLPRGVLVGVAAAVKRCRSCSSRTCSSPGSGARRGPRSRNFATCSLLAAAVDPSASWAYWTRYVTDTSRIGSIVYVSNQSLRAVIDRLAHHFVAAGPVTAASAVVLVGGLALATWAWRTSSGFLGVLVCATTGLLASPVSWAHHMVWVVPALVWLAIGADRPAGGRWWAASGVALFWGSPVFHVPYNHNVELTEHGLQLVMGNSFFGAMALFMVGVAAMLATRARTARRAARRGRAPDGSEPAPIDAVVGTAPAEQKGA